MVIVAMWIAAGAVFALLQNAALVFPVAACATAAIIAAAALPQRAHGVADWAFRYRWALAGALFLICVLLRIHGSSIGLYDEVLATQIVPGDSTLFGKPRWIRSDEFGVATPLFFSQLFNGYGLLSQQTSLGPMNMLLTYYSPVWDPAILGKPLAWGYLLLGNEAGLSWYWCGEEILLFMTAFEMCLILLQGRRFEALLGALLIWLAPQTQWWVIPHIPIVFMYAMAVFWMGYAFFTAKTAVAKWGSAAGVFVAVIGFSLSIFPSLQVPCAYIVITLLAVCLFRDREEISFTRHDMPRLTIVLLASLGMLAYCAAASWDGLIALLGTEYPGHRVSLGGNSSMSDLFPNPINLFLPYADSTYLNNCEVATSIHFAPLFLLLLPRMIGHLKRSEAGNAAVGIALACILVVEAVFMVIGIPGIIGDITLLRFCNRMYLVYGWTATLFTAWGISALIRHPDMLHSGEKIAYPLAYGVVACALVTPDEWEYFASLQIAGTSLGWLALALAVAAFVTVLAFAFFDKRFLLGSMLTLTLVFAGATVNPIEQGTAAITNHPISAAITQIAAQEPESRWLCTDCVFYLSNYVAANGAQTLDATNFYPDSAKWAIIDPEGRYGETTNRYANQSADLVEAENSVELVAPDSIRLHLNPETLKELGISYLFSRTDYTELLLGYGIECEQVASQDGYGIYRLG